MRPAPWKLGPYPLAREARSPLIKKSHRLWPICRPKSTPHYQGVSTENIGVRFGNRLRRLRLKHGWTQVEMAEKLGIDRSYISDMERGKKNVCLPTLEIIAKGVGLTISQVLKGL